MVLGKLLQPLLHWQCLEPQPWPSIATELLLLLLTRACVLHVPRWAVHSLRAAVELQASSERLLTPSLMGSSPAALAVVEQGSALAVGGQVLVPAAEGQSSVLELEIE